MNFIAIKKLPTFWNTFQKSGLVFTKIKSFLINNIIFKLFSKTKKTNENKVKIYVTVKPKNQKTLGNESFIRHFRNILLTIILKKSK